MADIHPGAGSSSRRSLTGAGGKLFFSASDGTTGLELWVHDPESDTTELFDLYPGAGGSLPQSLTNVAGVLLFAASDGTSGTGLELWRSDGTTSGTFLVQDIAEGPSSSSPGRFGCFVIAGDHVFFDANDDVTCTELWGGPVALVVGSPTLAIDGLIDDVAAVELAPFLERVLSFPLNQALDALEDGDESLASLWLQGFIFLVEALPSFLIPEPESAALIASAERALELLTP